MRRTSLIGPLVAVAAVSGLIAAPAASAVCQVTGPSTDLRIDLSERGTDSMAATLINATRGGRRGAPILVRSAKVFTGPGSGTLSAGGDVGVSRPFVLRHRGSSRTVMVARGTRDAELHVNWLRWSRGRVRSGCTVATVAKKPSVPAASVLPVVTGGAGTGKDARVVWVSNPKGAGPVEIAAVRVVGKGWGLVSKAQAQNAATVPVGGSVMLGAYPGYGPGTMLLTLKDGTVVSQPLQGKMTGFPYVSGGSSVTDQTVTLGLGDDYRRSFTAQVASVHVPETGGWKQISGPLAPFAPSHDDRLTFQRGSVDSAVVVTYAGGLFEGHQIRKVLPKAPSASPATTDMPVVAPVDGRGLQRDVEVSNPNGNGTIEVVGVKIVGEGWAHVGTDGGAPTEQFAVAVGAKVRLRLAAAYVPGTLLLTLKDGTVVPAALAQESVKMPHLSNVTVTDESVTLHLADDLKRPPFAAQADVVVPSTGGWKQTGGPVSPFAVAPQSDITFARGSVDSVAVVSYEGGLFEGHQFVVPLPKAPAALTPPAVVCLAACR